MARAKKHVAIKEDIKHVHEELYELESEDTMYKIFIRDTHLGIDDVLVLSTEEIIGLSCRDEESHASHLTSEDARNY